MSAWQLLFKCLMENINYLTIFPTLKIVTLMLGYCYMIHCICPDFGASPVTCIKMMKYIKNWSIQLTEVITVAAGK